MNLGLFLLRLTVGGIFAVHGYSKLYGEREVSPAASRYLGEGYVQMTRPGRPAFSGMLREMGVPMPERIASFVSGVELYGGIALVLGLFTRLAALLLIGDMAVAIWRVHWRHGLVGPQGAEFPLSLLGACVALLVEGPGKLSMDWLMVDHRQEGALDRLQTALLGR